MRRLVPRTLTGRLLAVLVTVVVITTVLVTVVTTLAMRGYLTDRLDQQVSESLERAKIPTRETSLPSPPPELPNDERLSRGQAAGTLSAWIDASGQDGIVVTDEGELQPLSTTVLDELEALQGGSTTTVTLTGLGDYRIHTEQAQDGTLVVAGLPTDEVSGILEQLVLLEALLGLLAVGVAAGAGRFLVHRQLRPLREVAATAHTVAELPLASGEIEMSVRVPEPLTDPRTEVGQVGAAMNTMLGHVEAALDARHRSEQQVRQFVADASHELRTPLATIHGYAELTRRTSSDPAQFASAMEKVENEATRMSVLVDDLLLLARLDAGRPLERREVDLTRLVLEAVADARVVGPQHRWELALPDEPVQVTGDGLRLHQVLTNLLANARRHTPAGTTVTVTVTQEPDRTLLCVHDDGPGLAPELVGRAFERFTRGDTSRTRASGGSGLGLSLVRAITTAHGGTVSVRSAPGDTTFTVTLPRTS